MGRSTTDAGKHNGDRGGMAAPHEAHGGGEAFGGHAHHAALFRSRFWVSVVLSVPVVLYSEMIQMWLGFSMPEFSGSGWIPPVLGTFVFLWGGWPFLKGGFEEAREWRPGMMLLIGMALTVAFVASAATTAGFFDLDFWWELVLLVTVMLLGHWLEMRAVGQASGALEALAAFLPDAAERVTDDGTETVSLDELRGGDVVLVRSGGRDVLHAGTALAGFVLGVAVGAAIVERGPERAAWTPAVTAALGLECVILVTFAAGWLLDGSEPSGVAVYPLIVLSALAMGVQSAAVRRLQVAGVSTTYITGTLTSLTARMVRQLRSASPERFTLTEPSERGLPLTADVWLAYGVGAVVGGAAELLWQPAALLLPVAAVAAVVVLMAARHREP
jgi:uncharacterized membrane protein YoaK (UPF0700 family)